MTLTQILALVGELDDSPGTNNPRERFRHFLKENAKDVGQLRDYIQECLTNKGPQYNRALQDLVNYIGTFLEFEVAFGRYQGVQGQNGFDGHWKSPKSFHIVTETKTTDAYAIKTLTLTGYIDALISEKAIPNWDCALGLYIVGRPDADLKQLENAIVAEKRTHQIRVISVESLLSLAEMMTEYDVTHQDVLDILRPSSPKIDPVVDLMARLVAQTQNETTQTFQPQRDEAPQLSKWQPGQATSLGDNVKIEDSAFWISPVKSDESETAEECINRLVGKGHYYAFGERTPGRKSMKSGDRIAFYATTKGVVAHATLSSPPERRPFPDGLSHKDYPWVCSLTDSRLYLEKPVAIDAKLRLQLDSFQGRNPEKGWAWFVQATRKVSLHDFELLTKMKQ